jgi:signal transduction histidine kinase
MTPLRLRLRGLVVALLLILFIDAFAVALYLGARFVLEDGMRSALRTSVLIAAGHYDETDTRAIGAIVEARHLDAAFLLDADDRVLWSTDPAMAPGRAFMPLATDRAEITAARAGIATAGFPFEAADGFLHRAYAPVAAPGRVLGITAAAPSFEGLETLERIFWFWIALSLLLALLIAALYQRAVREIREERLRADRGERFEALSRMAATVAHEIRNPLNIMSATVELRRGKIASDDDAERSVLEDLGEEIERIERVVHDFLDLSREPAIEIETVDLNETVELVVHREERRLLAGQRPAPEIRVVLDPHAGGLRADPGRIVQLFSNLIRNATEATGASGHVEIRTSGRGREVTVEIDDSGPGIPAAESEKVFEPFYTTRKKGTGLGLAVVRSIAEAHGGEVKVVASPLGGARFTVILPRE